MSYCRSKDIRRAHMITFGLLMNILAILAWKLLTEPYGALLFFFLFYVVCSLVFALYLLWQHRKYALSQEGIAVAYIPKWTRMIPWSSISEIAVCNLHYRTKLGWETVIRIVVGPEFEGPSHGNGKWAIERYSMKYHYRIILIDYTKETLEKFRAICPLPIPDYR